MILQWLGVILGACSLVAVVFGGGYQVGQIKGTLTQVDKRLSRIEDYIFNGKGGK